VNPIDLMLSVYTNLRRDALKVRAIMAGNDLPIQAFVMSAESLRCSTTQVRDTYDCAQLRWDFAGRDRPVAESLGFALCGGCTLINSPYPGLNAFIWTVKRQGEHTSINGMPFVAAHDLVMVASNFMRDGQGTYCLGYQCYLTSSYTDMSEQVFPQTTLRTGAMRDSNEHDAKELMRLQMISFNYFFRSLSS
jgi:hypothetical protein